MPNPTHKWPDNMPRHERGLAEDLGFTPADLKALTPLAPPEPKPKDPDAPPEKCWSCWKREAKQGCSGQCGPCYQRHSQIAERDLDVRRRRFGKTRL